MSQIRRYLGSLMLMGLFLCYFVACPNDATARRAGDRAP
jgi:hypothetical protein